MGRLNAKTLFKGGSAHSGGGSKVVGSNRYNNESKYVVTISALLTLLSASPHSGKLKTPKVGTTS